jgi:hypothetical protein
MYELLTVLRICVIKKDLGLIYVYIYVGIDTLKHTGY